MGRIFSRFFRRSDQAATDQNQQQTTNVEEPKKAYSWDTRARVDPSEYTYEKLNDTIVGKTPGSLNGQPLIIQQCQNTRVFIFDHSATITVDDCSNCQFYFGPVRGSVFIRNCKNCVAVIACQQFRTRDCSKCDVFLACATQPIIEASNNIRFGCFQLFYPELNDQFRAAKINVLSVNWSGVHDFTPVSGLQNFSVGLSDVMKPTDIVTIPSDNVADDTSITPSNSASIKDLAAICERVSCDVASSVIPLTFGPHLRVTEEPTCVVILFCDGETRGTELDDRGVKFVRAAYEPFTPTACRLIRSQAAKVDNDDFSRIFGEELAQRFGKLLRKPIAVLEFNGPESVQRCETAIATCSISKDGAHTVSGSTARSTASQFFDFLSSQLSP